MILFITFVFAAVIIGAGAMLAPAWQTERPRIGLAAALILAVIIGGAGLWAVIFQWNTLIVDYLLFGIVSAVILGGTIVQAQQNQADVDSHWFSTRDKIFLAMITSLCLLLALWVAMSPWQGHLNDPTRQIMTSQSMQAVQSVRSLGFHMLSAYLSSQLHQGIPTVQAGLAIGLALLLTLIAYDFGVELHSATGGYIIASGLFIVVILPILLLTEQYDRLLTVIFVIAALTYILRLSRQVSYRDCVALSVILFTLLLTNPL